MSHQKGHKENRYFQWTWRDIVIIGKFCLPLNLYNTGLKISDLKTNAYWKVKFHICHGVCRCNSWWDCHLSPCYGNSQGQRSQSYSSSHLMLKARKLFHVTKCNLGPFPTTSLGMGDQLLPEDGKSGAWMVFIPTCRESPSTCLFSTTQVLSKSWFLWGQSVLGLSLFLVELQILQPRQPPWVKRSQSASYLVTSGVLSGASDISLKSVLNGRILNWTNNTT